MSKNKELQPKTYVSGRHEDMLLDLIKKDEGFQKAVESFSNGSLEELNIVYKAKQPEKKIDFTYIVGEGFTKDFDGNISPTDELRQQVEERLKGRTLERVNDGLHRGWEYRE